jgi:hypothetical protein
LVYADSEALRDYVIGEEWAFVDPYLALVHQGTPQRLHERGEIFGVLRWISCA